MNTEQERAEFEAAMDGLRFDRSDDGTYTSSVTRVALEAYQAGRAALQSQDREDAERYRAWRKAASEGRGWATEAFMAYLFKQTRGVRLPEEAELDAAIDHARRIEGGGE